MPDLVDYLRDKLQIVESGCICPSIEWLATLPLGVVVISDCVEHGRVRRTVGGFGYGMVGRGKSRWRR